MLENPKIYLTSYVKQSKIATMDNQQERQIFDRGWLIGLLDGEGSFMIGKIKRVGRDDFYPCVNISNANFSMIEKAQSVIKSLGIPCNVIHKIKKHIKQKNYWSLNVQGLKRVKRFMDVLFPYIECRRDQADALRQYVELRLSKPAKSPFTQDEFNLINKLRKLNGSQRFESSETICQAPNLGEDIVRPSMRIEEVDRNVQPLSVTA